MCELRHDAPGEGRPTTIRCVVADDHPMLRDAACDFLIENGVDVVARASDGEEAVEKIGRHRPSVAVLDVQMPRLNGIEVARRLARTSPDTRIVFYTGVAQRAVLAEALDAGARGFVVKDAPPDDLLRAVRLVSEGRSYVDAALAGVLVAGTDRIVELTQRERDVLRLLADGLRNDEIGARLFVSEETVRTHLQKAMRKLDANTRTQAVAAAIRQSLIA